MGHPRRPASDLHGRALLVTLGCMSAQLAMGAIYLRGVLSPAILEEFGWARGDYMAAGTPQTAVTALASPVAGFLTQRYGARPVLSFGVTFLFVLYWGFGEMRTLWQFFALSIGVGVLVASVGDVASGTVVAKWVAKGRGLALGIVYTGSNLGGAIFAVLGGLLAVQIGWRETFFWVGLCGPVILLPIVLLSVREPPQGFVPASAAGGGTDPSMDSSLGVPLVAALRTPAFWLLWIALFLFFLYFIGVNAHLALYLSDMGLSRQSVALNYGMVVAMGVGAKLGIGVLADRWPAKTALLINFGFVVLAGMLLISVPAYRFLIPVFVVVHGIATMAQNVVYPLIVAHVFGTRYMAEIFGVIMLALFPGGILGPVLAGYMHDWTGSYALVFQLYTALSVVAFILLAAVRRVVAPPLARRANQGAAALP